MTQFELNDVAQAQRYLLQSWSLTRSERLEYKHLQSVLSCALELASEGRAIPPLGFIADLMHILHAADRQAEPLPTDSTMPDIMVHGAWTAPLIDATLARRYDDYVLGKLAADLSLERAADELPKYSGRDRYRAIAFIIEQVQQRAGLDGVIVAPAAIKSIQARSTADVELDLQTAFAGGYDPPLIEQWDELIQSVRNVGELLGPEDIFELHSGTALSGYGQRIALRHVIQATESLGRIIPKHKPSQVRRHATVATNILEEDFYPVGGFTSISNRGTIESMLRSELAYMETDERPDLFDIKYARDELLYYSRDENQFYRRRVAVLLVLDPSLVAARVKDEHGHWQRIVYTLASLLLTVRTLTEWLASESLSFQVCCLSGSADFEMRDEADLLQLIFAEEISAGRMTLSRMTQRELMTLCENQSRQCLCHCIWYTARRPHATAAPFSWGDPAPRWQPLWTALDVSQACPRVVFDEQAVSFEESSDPWSDALITLVNALECT